MPKQIRLAVVGAGNQCTQALMPGIPSIPEFDLVAVADMKRDLAERNARNFGGRAVYTDVAEMLRQERPDACIVVGPPQMHHDVGMQVLEAGAHLFIEKPASPTLKEAKELADTAKRVGKIGQVGHMMRHADPVRIAWDICHQPEFGEILHVESKYVTWPTGPAAKGSGWGDADEDWMYMLVQGGHPIDLLRHFLGEPTRVAAFKRQGVGHTKVYSVTLQSAAGRTGFLNLQDSYEGWYTGLEIVGDGKCTVRVDDLGEVTYRRGEQKFQAEKQAWWGHPAHTWQPHHMTKLGQRAGYANQLKHFADCILGGTNPQPSLWDGYRNLVVARAILDAVAGNKVVEMGSD